MPSSFDAMHDETRPLRMLEEAPRPHPVTVVLGSVLLLVMPLLAVLLL